MGFEITPPYSIFSSCCLHLKMRAVSSLCLLTRFPLASMPSLRKTDYSFYKLLLFTGFTLAKEQLMQNPRTTPPCVWLNTPCVQLVWGKQLGVTDAAPGLSDLSRTKEGMKKQAEMWTVSSVRNQRKWIQQRREETGGHWITKKAKRERYIGNCPGYFDANLT